MKPFNLSIISVLLASVSNAQESKPQGVGPVPPKDIRAVQEPEAAPKPVDSTELLKKSLEVAQREKKYLQIVLDAGGLLKRFKDNFDVGLSMDANFAPAAKVKDESRKVARLMGDKEKHAIPKDIAFTVASAQVSQTEYGSMVDYLRSYPHDNTKSVHSQAIVALSKAKVALGVFPQSAAKARQAIEKIAKELAGGKSFSELAKLHSDDRESGKNGGKIGFVVRDAAEENYARAAFGLKMGQVSGIVETPYGYQLIRVTGGKKGATADKDQVKTSRILKSYGDPAKIAALLKSIDAGSVDLAFREDETLKKAPAQFK